MVEPQLQDVEDLKAEQEKEKEKQKSGEDKEEVWGEAMVDSPGDENENQNTDDDTLPENPTAKCGIRHCEACPRDLLKCTRCTALFDVSDDGQKCVVAEDRKKACKAVDPDCKACAGRQAPHVQVLRSGFLAEQDGQCCQALQALRGEELQVLPAWVPVRGVPRRLRTTP